MIVNRFLPASLLCAGLALALHPPVPAWAGAACAVAKEMGNSLAIEWVAAADESGAGARDRAREKLVRQGFRRRYGDVFIQGATELSHAHGVVVKTRYRTRIGTQRTSYGCGFSSESPSAAEWAALRDLQTYSWGWRPDLGYEVVERFRY